MPENKANVQQSQVRGVVCYPLKTISLKSVGERTVYRTRGNYTQRLYVEALQQAGCWVDFQAESVLKGLEFFPSQFFPAEKHCEVWVFHTLKTFQGMRRSEFFEKIVSAHRDIVLCPPEVGPELRLQYPEQGYGEVLKIGMRDLFEGSTNNGIFLVTNTSVFGEENKRKLMIGSNTINIPYVVNNESWVFMKPL